MQRMWMLLAWLLTTPVTAQTLYRVVVIPGDEATLTQVQTRVEDAYLSEYQGDLLLIAGSFSSQQLAERHVAALQEYGFTAEVLGETSPLPTQQTQQEPLETAAAPQSPPTTVPPERPFLTVISIPPGRDAAAWLVEIQRLFPDAIATPSGIQVGQFSQYAQAQIQVDWLQRRGYAAQVREATAPSNPAVTPNPAVTDAASPDPVTASGTDNTASGFWVLVADPLGDREAALQRLMTEATPLTYRELRVVRTGRFASEAEAAEQANFLTSQGFEAGVFPSLAEASATAESTQNAFRVLIPFSESALSQVLAINPDAFARTWEGRRVIQFATYARASNAEAAVATLAGMGLTAEVIRE